MPQQWRQELRASEIVWNRVMSDIAIRVEGLSKLFRIGSPERYRTLRDTLIDTLAAPFRFMRSGGSNKSPSKTIWALKDVSFEVKHGEVIGIIGRNGAGKSTLLKILSRITEPTKGHVEIHGRVGSLLEVGTGFHPELTGRENIFLNGAILGMKKVEILRKFDEIVAFAEIEKFIDTPVKHYSSGMYVRLAFAVAAHMQSEILIVDEVLAVGDVEFQKKCLGRMKEVSAGGRTVLFVSHNLDVVSRICGRAALLAGGRLEDIGICSSIVSGYQRSKQSGLRRCSFRIGEATLVTRLALHEHDGSQASRTLSLTLESDRSLKISECALIVYTLSGQRVGLIDFRDCLDGVIIQKDVENMFALTIDNCDLVSGDYDLKLWIESPGGSADIELGHAAILNTSNVSSYLTRYPDSLNGITKFRGSIRHVVPEVVKR
jgi:lipopolysaccharide transport system ATP-binding protein